MFVQLSDFDSYPYQIPNLEHISNSFEDWVKVAEEDILRQLLGNVVYDAFIVALQTNPTSGQWFDLKNGAIYEIKYKWVGMEKMLIPYLYSEYLNFSFQDRTSLGMTLANSENSTVINPGPEIVKSWNDFRRIVGGVFEQENTLYGFMESGDYEGWTFKNPGYKNIFGL